jgi:hypothetical protein
MDDNKRMNLIKILSGLLVVGLGLGFFLWYRYGQLTDSAIWIVVAVVGSVVILFIAGIFFLPRSRIQKTSRTFEYRTDQHNREYFESQSGSEIKDFIPSKKVELDIIFCSYCGNQVGKGVEVCSNCGKTLE